MIINDSKNMIKNYIDAGNKVSEKKKLEFAKIIFNKYKKYKELEFNNVFLIINQLLKLKYKLCENKLNIQCLRDCDFMFDKIKIPKEFKKNQEHFDKLKNLPQPEQRTKEWFDYRFNRITASDTAAAIDLNPYEPVESFILKKCDPNHKFLDNENVYHGKKYEPIATSIYEQIFNIKVIEFGALPSEKYNFLGASPDGICSSQTLDYKFSPMLGRMLEIKCTVGRKIYHTGKIAGHICPFYYYCQVQQQLECCELENCDFWQCKITEYQNREEYLVDTFDNNLYTKNEESNELKYIEMVFDDTIKKGIILKFLPKIWTPEFDGDSIEWKSKFIYPKNLLMDENEYDSWVTSTLTNWKINYPDIDETHYFDKIVYWKLEECHNVTIKRDLIFFQNILPILNETWQKVLYYRNNIDKLQELKEIVEKRKKYIKFDTQIKVSNDIINKKILFLNYTDNPKILKIKSFKEEESDFLD